MTPEWALAEGKGQDARAMRMMQSIAPGRSRRSPEESHAAAETRDL
jgi:hypothetical protein